MINSKLIDATAHKPQTSLSNWKAIPWDRARECVRRLQIRIAKAWLKKDYRKVKNLRRLLLKSIYARMLAVNRVTTNKGSKTPGIDGIIWKSPTAKIQAVHRLGKGTYKPLPLRRIHIPKKNGKSRALGIPTKDDRALQALHLLALEPIAESTGDQHSYGFRPCRSTADAIAQCFIILARKTSAQYILEGDIKACFDEISHEWMLEHIPMDRNILKKMLKAGYMEKGIFHETEIGTTQGGLASPTIANMVLDGIHDHLQTAFGAKKIKEQKVHFVRYADDFIVTANSQEFLENEVKPSLEAFFNARGLRLSQEKTVVTHIQQGFTFLGQTVRKFKDKLIIKPSDKGIKNLLGKIRDICSEHKQATTETIIRELNPIIRGWANYHRHVVSSEIFGKVDNEIHKILWRWAKRRHPNKSLGWVKKKYFKTHQGRNWVFSCESNKKGSQLHLFRASQIKIKRHIKVKQDANPFNPEWEVYYERREQNKLREKKQGKIINLQILAKQQHLCALCQKPILPKSNWEYHFKQHWMHGGQCRSQNLAAVHSECHESLHVRID